MEPQMPLAHVVGAVAERCEPERQRVEAEVEPVGAAPRDEVGPRVAKPEGVPPRQQRASGRRAKLVLRVGGERRCTGRRAINEQPHARCVLLQNLYCGWVATMHRQGGAGAINE